MSRLALRLRAHCRFARQGNRVIDRRCSGDDVWLSGGSVRVNPSILACFMGEHSTGGKLVGGSRIQVSPLSAAGVARGQASQQIGPEFPVCV